jgi:hypothetical protein
MSSQEVLEDMVEALRDYAQEFISDLERSLFRDRETGNELLQGLLPEKRLKADG